MLTSHGVAFYRSTTASYEDRRHSQICTGEPQQGGYRTYRWGTHVLQIHRAVCSQECRMVRFGNVTVGVKYPFEGAGRCAECRTVFVRRPLSSRAIVLTRPPHTHSCFTGSQNVCVVGNGPLTDVQRKEIDGCERCIASIAQELERGEDRRACTEGARGYACLRGPRHGTASRRCLVGMHADNDARNQCDRSEHARARAFDAFKTCKTNNSVSTNPSAGTILLSTLQADHNVWRRSTSTA